jgi:hypothetical protein
LKSRLTQSASGPGVAADQSVETPFRLEETVGCTVAGFRDHNRLVVEALEAAFDKRDQPVERGPGDASYLHTHRHVMEALGVTQSASSVPYGVKDFGPSDSDVLQLIVGHLHETALVTPGDLCLHPEARP